jgi:hypothetical protein
MSSRSPGEETDPTVNESGDEEGSPVTDATPVDITAGTTVDDGSDPPMTDAGEVGRRRVDDGESRAEDAVNESA